MQASRWEGWIRPVTARSTASSAPRPRRIPPGYGRRSLAETAVGRHEAIIGPKLRARSLPAQQGEAAIAVETLDRMIRASHADLRPRRLQRVGRGRRFPFCCPPAPKAARALLGLGGIGHPDGGEPYAPTPDLAEATGPDLCTNAGAMCSLDESCGRTACAVDPRCPRPARRPPGGGRALDDRGAGPLPRGPAAAPDARPSRARREAAGARAGGREQAPQPGASRGARAGRVAHRGRPGGDGLRGPPAALLRGGP